MQTYGAHCKADRVVCIAIEEMLIASEAYMCIRMCWLLFIDEDGMATDSNVMPVRCKVIDRARRVVN